MSYGPVVMKIPILFFFSSMFLRTNGDPYYTTKITERVIGCDSFENKLLNCDELVLGSEGDEEATLGGKITTGQDIDTDCDISIDIYKIMNEIGEELMWSILVPFCDSVKDSDAPWYPVVQEMNITGCPVPSKVFEVQGLSISLESVKDMMCHDFCGEYRVEMSFICGRNKVSCHNIEICIVEVNDDDRE